MLFVWRAHVIYFLTARLQHPSRPSRKISINNRQTARNYAACSRCLSRERGKRSPSLRWIFIFEHFERFSRKYSLNPVNAIFQQRQEEEEEEVLKSHCQSSRRSSQLWHHISIMINYTQQDNFKVILYRGLMEGTITMGKAKKTKKCDHQPPNTMIVCDFDRSPSDVMTTVA